MSVYTASGDWCTVRKPNPSATMKLFCFPYAGAGPSIFYGWHSMLPADIEICAIQLPGRANRMRERPFNRVPELIAKLAPALCPLLDRPFAFFGHSMGAILSFETARWLRRNRQVLPGMLLVSGRRAPQIPNTDPFLHTMGDDEFLDAIRELDGTPAEVMKDADLMRLILPVLRADFELCETYEYTNSGPLRCPIAAFAGKADKEEPLASMAPWRAQTEDLFVLHAIDGGHFFIHSNERELLDLLHVTLLGKDARHLAPNAEKTC